MNHIGKFIREAIATVMHSYQRYLRADLPVNLEDPSKIPSEFKAFHDAGKSAASHLDSLIKLGKVADSDESEKQENHEESEAFRHALHSAKQEIDGKNKE